MMYLSDYWRKPKFGVEYLVCMLVHVFVLIYYVPIKIWLLVFIVIGIDIFVTIIDALQNIFIKVKILYQTRRFVQPGKKESIWKTFRRNL
jgi:hypothetical protein